MYSEASAMEEETMVGQAFQQEGKSRGAAKPCVAVAVVAAVVATVIFVVVKHSGGSDEQASPPRPPPPPLLPTPSCPSVTGAGYSSGFVTCTSPSLHVHFAEPVGELACGRCLSRWNPALGNGPKITYPDADPSQGYVLMMIDPDAKSRVSPTVSPIRHWLIVNIPGSALLAGDVGGGPVGGPAVGQGTVLSEYHPPGPPNQTGYHRYGFLLFKQPNATLTYASLPTNIAHFHFRAFAQQHQLGAELRSNVMLAQGQNDFFACTQPLQLGVRFAAPLGNISCGTPQRDSLAQTPVSDQRSRPTDEHARAQLKNHAPRGPFVSGAGDSTTHHILRSGRQQAIRATDDRSGRTEPHGPA
jgi:phosphatidylethanolamine-binding protein (PEBP) family uncharacterized protein